MGIKQPPAAHLFKLSKNCTKRWFFQSASKCIHDRIETYILQQNNLESCLGKFQIAPTRIHVISLIFLTVAVVVAVIVAAVVVVVAVVGGVVVVAVDLKPVLLVLLHELIES